jgi:hypothetical protein
MNNYLSLDRIRSWPRWAIIPFSLGLAVLAIVLGLLLEGAAGALTPVQQTPTPTMPAIAYGQGRSTGCPACHFSLAALQASAAEPDAAETYLIEPESVMTPHGRLGCIACHGGEGEAQDKVVAHQDLVPDMSVKDPEKCVICHQGIPSEIPGDRLRVPHGLVIDRVEAGETCNVYCSDCHGGVGHGFDPVSGQKHCSMTVCVDCHEERNLDVQMADCDACHLGPHDVATSLTCNDCHTSTAVWNEVALGVHPVALPGRHGEVVCFTCHQYPDFKGLNNVCTDCHASGHSDWGDHDCAQCHDPGGTWDMIAQQWEEHAQRWDQYKGQHLQVTCRGCHFETYQDLDPSCGNCHKAPESHEGNRDTVECMQCHQADQPWMK